MAAFADERAPTEEEGIAHRVARRATNEQKAADGDLPADAQGLVELACECSKSDCERAIRVPLYVYRRMLVAGDQYLLQAGHHAFPRYRTIVSVGMMRIEESA